MYFLAPWLQAENTRRNTTLTEKALRCFNMSVSKNVTSLKSRTHSVVRQLFGRCTAFDSLAPVAPRVRQESVGAIWGHWEAGQWSPGPLSLVRLAHVDWSSRSQIQPILL